MQEAKTATKVVLVIHNGIVLMETSEYGDALAFCAGMKNKDAEIFKGKRVPSGVLRDYASLASR